MKFEVILSKEAEEDFFEIYDYVADHDSIGKANNLYKKLKETCDTLEFYPNRGHYPPELLRVNIREYKEIHFKPYRIIYQIIESKVFIHCVLDGRRNLQDLLQERLLR